MKKVIFIVSILAMLTVSAIARTWYDEDGNVISGSISSDGVFLTEKEIAEIEAKEAEARRKLSESTVTTKKTKERNYTSPSSGNFTRSYSSVKACYDIAAMAHLTAIRDSSVKESNYEHGVATIEFKSGRMVNYTCLDNVLMFTEIHK
ncbi:hypothetical protein UWK_03612 (plasmid) [Desulfocapsa sulfexigens DSM 10523]|uniref:DUF4124 domain-containing protein n=1 Tax=Desulfocapsa sulfexigens (strain DSM 10523 / SB164P1) TaxID=1167006 RepID=M1PUW8_DESSD|nr:hypothetical protein [Desulfocapsa sulfexigens]AGF80121.1 hypothetical protein UWK_03612 [Desulfocapsa sulfexigens DSM 10523]